MGGFQGWSLASGHIMMHPKAIDSLSVSCQGTLSPGVGWVVPCAMRRVGQRERPLLTSCVGDAILNNFNNLLGNLRLTRRTRHKQQKQEQ